MEEYHGGAAHHHPLLHSAGRLHLHQHPSAYTDTQWDDDPPHQLAFDGGGQDQQQLREALLRALAELDASRAELRRVESEAARLVASAAAERDELRRHYHSLLLLLHQYHTQPPPPPPTDPLLHAAGFLDLQGGGGCAAMDAAAAGGTTRTAASLSSEEGDYAEAEAELEMARRLPEKGRLVEAVVSAGPLLQTLLLAGPLPRWRHPPPPAPADMVIPPFNPGGAANGNSSFSSASASSSPESDNRSGGGLPVVALGQQHQLPQQDALPCFGIITTSPFCM